MNFFVRRRDDGQIVEVAYAYHEGVAYRRTTDRSDGSVSYECGELDWEREPECIDYDRVPCVVSWEPCPEPA